jgi:hypothetical protein
MKQHQSNNSQSASISGSSGATGSEYPAASDPQTSQKKAWHIWFGIGIALGIAVAALLTFHSGQITTSQAATSSIAVQIPNGGETWAVGSSQVIAWISAGVDNVRIDLLRSGQVVRNIVSSASAGLGRYNWKVPSNQPLGTDYAVRVSDAANTAVKDESDAPFEIVSSGAAAAGDYLIATPGAVIKDQTITVSGSVIIAADDVTLHNVVIKCRGTASDEDGIRAVNVHRLKVRLVLVDGCKRHGIFLQNGSGHDIAEGEIRNVGKEAVVFDGVSESWLIGWELRGGVALRNASHHNRVIATIVVGNGQGSNSSPYPYSISVDSYANQIVRSRARDSGTNAATVISQNPDNLFYQDICEKVSGYARCYFLDNRALDGNYGDPSKFSPRIWTICSQASTANAFACDFGTYNQAALDPRVRAGEILVMDSKTISKNIVPPLVIAKPLWLIGEIMAQKGNYACNVNVGDGTRAGITITAPGVRIENMQVNLAPALPSDTDIVNIRIKDSSGRWTVMGVSKPVAPQPLPPGC